MPREGKGREDIPPQRENGEGDATAACSRGCPQTQGEQNEGQLFSGSSPRLSSQHLSLAKLRRLSAWDQGLCISQKWNENQALIEDLVHRKGLGMESRNH